MNTYHSAWGARSRFDVKCSLVVIIGIGDYGGEMPELIGIEKDYNNIIYTFYKQFGYSVVLWDKNNNLCYWNKNGQKQKTKKYKIKWTDEEIYKFIDQVVEIVSTGKHDSLLFFISSHGDSEGVILDSQCDEISLLSIFSNFFGNKCVKMLNKPKIFIIDSCRGSMKSRVKKQLTPRQRKTSTLRVVAPIHAYDDTEITRGFSKKKSSVNQRRTTLKQLFHAQANCRFIYANPEGYAALDGGSKGGYLIRATKCVFLKKEIEKQSLDNIVNQIRMKTRKMVGKGTMENVQDVNQMNFDVYFTKCTH